jgi:hypothetical protein
MTRVSPALEIFTLSFDAADPFYAPNPAGELTAWYVPSPSLMAWFAKTLEGAEAARKKLTTNQLRDLERMKKAFAGLAAEFPIGSSPCAPCGQTPQEFIEVSKFVAGSGRCLTPRDLAASYSSSYRHPPRKILAWRPINSADAEASRLRGITDRSITAQKKVESIQ